MSDRHPCRCSCPCPSSADPSADRCPTCSVGIHRPSRTIQEHLRDGLDRWIELMPSTLGSSGLSVKQVVLAGDAWRAWHAERRCPVKAAA